jgi:ankyrin repeat protein
MVAIILNIKTVILYLLGCDYTEEEEWVSKKNALVNVNAVDGKGKTALHYAIKPSKYGTILNEDIIEVLLKSKANPSINDNEGHNALDYCSSMPSIYQLIVRYYPGSKPNKIKPIA